MDYAHLDRTGLKVSRIALGMMNSGELTDRPASTSSTPPMSMAGHNRPR